MMVTIENIDFSYQRNVPIFSNFSWSIARDEIWSVIAPSGYGKTTLLYLLAGLYLPAAGKISIHGEPLLGPRLSTGLILQDYGLLPWSTAFDNVSLGLKIRRVKAGKVNKIAHEWLSKLNIETVSHHYPIELSGGQRQRVAIARTLALEPDLLLMDEPFASLDALTRENLQNLIIKLHEDMPTITILLVTHNIEEAVFLGEKILVLKNLPNKYPTVIENPGSRNSGYRNTSHFTERCEQLRGMLSCTAEIADNTLKMLNN
jgi:NitT/TauT family transport system ATP-binding protein